MATAWFAKNPNLFGSNVVLCGTFHVGADGKLDPQPEPGSPDEARCQQFWELFGQVEVADNAEGASVAPEQESAPALGAAEAAEKAPVDTPVATPSVVGSTGLVESPTVTKRIKSKFGG